MCMGALKARSYETRPQPARRAGTRASLLYKAEKPSVRLTVTPLTQLPLHGSTWDLVCIELWYLACEHTFK